MAKGIGPVPSLWKCAAKIILFFHKKNFFVFFLQFSWIFFCFEGFFIGFSLIFFLFPFRFLLYSGLFPKKSDLLQSFYNGLMSKKRK